MWFDLLMSQLVPIKVATRVGLLSTNVTHKTICIDAQMVNLLVTLESSFVTKDLITMLALKSLSFVCVDHEVVRAECLPCLKVSLTSFTSVFSRELLMGRLYVGFELGIIKALFETVLTCLCEIESVVNVFFVGDV